jgi:Cys-tRNA(Pro)/Cys-tRNA(Cys) deacylase
LALGAGGDARLVDHVTVARSGTPALVALQRSGVAFAVHEFDHRPGERNYGAVAAEAIGADPGRVFKTLLADADGVHVVAIVPVSGQLSTRLLAAAVGARRASMCPPAVAERLTGYVVGGISPFGQRSRLRTVLDETAILYDTIFVSGGRRGLDVELAPDDLLRLLDATLAPIAAG